MTRFQQAHLKLKWAGQHINQLNAIWQAYLQTDFCKLVVEDHSQRGEVLRLKAEPIPGEIILILGDAVHNMRCALDFAINEILGGKNTRLTFPMGETREELVSALSTDPGTPCGACGRGNKKGRAAAIEEAVPGIAAHIVETIRPYKASGSPLWILNKLDARDKHRLLIPTIAFSKVTGVNTVDDDDNRMFNATASVGAGGILSMVAFGSGGLKVESYNKPTAEILLNEPGVIENASLIPTLVNTFQAVNETLLGLDEFLTATEAA